MTAIAPPLVALFWRGKFSQGKISVENVTRGYNIRAVKLLRPPKGSYLHETFMAGKGSLEHNFRRKCYPGYNIQAENFFRPLAHALKESGANRYRHINMNTTPMASIATMLIIVVFAMAEVKKDDSHKKRSWQLLSYVCLY